MAVSFSRELTAALGRHVQGWKNNLNEAWHPLAMQWAEGLTPTSISSTNVEHIFPRLDVTEHCHVFKAFDNLSPAEVRVVLLGQDPYPNEAQATGRAFEQGDLESFSALKPRVAHSLNMMLRMMVKATVVQADERLKTKREDLRTLLAQAPLEVVSPAQVFDLLVAQGVLFLNASLTIPKSASRRSNGYLRGHLAFWRPFVQAVLRDLLVRNGSAPVFLLMGKPAQRLFDDMTASTCTSTRTRVVRSTHPSANSFCREANPFTLVNDELSATGVQPVKWLPTA